MSGLLQMGQKVTISRFGKNQCKRKKSKLKFFIFGAIIFSILIVILSLVVEEAIRYNIVKLSVDNDANATWIGSLASYWGGIIGGIFSGTIAILGVFYTIQFTREADRKKERQSIQPFLNIEITTGSLESVRTFKIATKESSSANSGKNANDLCLVPVSITNIGNGFANTLTFGTGENLTGVKFSEVFTINQRKKVLLKVQKSQLMEGANFFIWFTDSMTNEYIQHYELRRNNNNGKIDLDVGYPDLIE